MQGLYQACYRQGLSIGVTTADVTDRVGALAMFDRRGETSSMCRRYLWMGVMRRSPLPVRCEAVRSFCGSGEAQRTSYPRGSSEAMDSGAILCLSGKVSPTLEELRKKAQYQSANGGACLRRANPEKIVNRPLKWENIKIAHEGCPTFYQGNCPVRAGEG